MIQKKQCRVCGGEYEPCRTHAPQNGKFRWRDVACSPDCGAIYLQRIKESRGLVSNEIEKLETQSDGVEVAIEPEVQADTLDSNRD